MTVTREISAPPATPLTPAPPRYLLGLLSGALRVHDARSSVIRVLLAFLLAPLALLGFSTFERWVGELSLHTSPVITLSNPFQWSDLLSLANGALPVIVALAELALLLSALIGTFGFYYAAAEWRKLGFAAYIGRFIAAWWRSCLIAYLFALLATLYGGLFWPDLSPLFGMSFFLVIGLAPAEMARAAQRRTLRSNHWRPECPECGFTLRYNSQPLCQECGVPFPTPRRAYRRWAVRRLEWDRQTRAMWPLAWFRSLVMILIRPRRAARGLAIPDNAGRAWRWALGSALFGAILLNPAAHENRLYDFLAQTITGQFLYPSSRAGDFEPPLFHLVWVAIEALLAQIIAITAGLIPAWILSLVWPGLNPAARRGWRKWSLYALPAYILPLVLWELGIVWRGLPAGAALAPSLTAISILRMLSSSGGGWMLPGALAYAVIWAWGAAWQPYAANRGRLTALLLCAGYLTVWALLFCVVIPPGILEKLL